VHGGQPPTPSSSLGLLLAFQHRPASAVTGTSCPHTGPSGPFQKRSFLEGVNKLIAAVEVVVSTSILELLGVDGLEEA
jgi:hypothetical protein